MQAETYRVNSVATPTLIRWWRKTYRPLKSNHKSSWRLFSHVRVAVALFSGSSWLRFDPKTITCSTFWRSSYMSRHFWRHSNALTYHGQVQSPLANMNEKGRPDTNSFVRSRVICVSLTAICPETGEGQLTQTHHQLFFGVSWPDPPSLL